MDADNAVTQTAAGRPDGITRPARAPAEYELFYRSQYRAMMVIAMHAGATRHQADELTAATLLQMYDAWPQITNRFAWARRALINNLKDLRRAEQRRLLRQGRYLADNFQRPPDAHAGCLDDPYVREELLGVLTPGQRRVVELILQELTPDEIGLLLGTTRETVTRNLRNIRRRLERRRGSATSSPTDRAPAGDKSDDA